SSSPPSVPISTQPAGYLPALRPRCSLDAITARATMIGKPTVLFVDNEATTRRMFDVQFTAFGIPHYIADSPENAVHILTENPVDIVVTDLIEPGDDGTDLIQCLRNSPETE